MDEPVYKRGRPFTEAERERCRAFYAAGLTIPAIGKFIDRAPDTLYQAKKDSNGRWDEERRKFRETLGAHMQDNIFFCKQEMMTLLSKCMRKAIRDMLRKKRMVNSKDGPVEVDNLLDGSDMQAIHKTARLELGDSTENIDVEHSGEVEIQQEIAEIEKILGGNESKN